MNDPKTKRAAEQLAECLDVWADDWYDVSVDPHADKGSKRVAETVASRHRAEAARLRALIPTLPE